MDRDRVAGSVRKAGGKVERAVGEGLGDEKLEAEGVVDQAVGAAQAALGQTKDAAREYLDHAGEYVEGAREAAGRAVERGRRYVDDGFERFPEAQERFERGRAVVGREIGDNPIVALLIAGAVGYGLALLIHGRRGEEERPAARPRRRGGRS